MGAAAAAAGAAGAAGVGPVDGWSRASCRRCRTHPAAPLLLDPLHGLLLLLLPLPLLQEHDVLVRHGVQVRVIGDLSLAPPGVQAAAEAIMDATRHHDRAVLNLCFSYT